MQPRDTCYVASSGLTPLVYSGYRPDAYSWDDFPPLKEILDAVRLKTPPVIHVPYVVMVVGSNVSLF